MLKSWRACIIAAALLAVPVGAQQYAPAERQAGLSPEEAPGGSHVLEPGDRVRIDVLDAEEISQRAYLIGDDGKISLPLLGRIQAAGLTVEEFEASLVSELDKYFRDPRVAVSVTETREQPVVLGGAFNRPGTYRIHGNEKLSEILSSAGGLSDDAQKKLLITRRLDSGGIPLPSAKTDPQRRVTTAEIELNDVMQPLTPAEDLVLRPYDIITALPSRSVFISGQVGKPGRYPLEQREALPVTRLVTLAGGLTADAVPKKAYILRPTGEEGVNETIPVNVKHIMKGQAEDFAVQPGDVLMIPGSSGKKLAMRRMMMIILPAAITTAIWVALAQ